MVDQNASPQQTTSSIKDSGDGHADSKESTAPSVVKAGEMMLIFALVLILLVCIAVSWHLYKRRQKRHRKKDKKHKQDKAGESDTHPSQQKCVELVGTPLCEMGESEPRHEMEDAEVLERYTTVGLENPRHDPVFSPPGSDHDLEAGESLFGQMTTQSTTGPDAAAHAVYWSRAM